MTRILIVDDETSASNILRLLLEKQVPGEKEIRICDNASDALEVIPLFAPTLLMLDIKMPHMNGFDLLNQLGAWDFDIIFTTAYDQYAIKAIRFSALDYLLKPIDIVELQNAVYRHMVRKENKIGQQVALVDNLMNNLYQKDTVSFKLALNTSERYYFIAPQDIIRCEGLDNYTKFYMNTAKELLVSRTLKEFEEILAEHNFVRVHKSHLANMSYVTRFDKENIIWFNNGDCIPVSRRKKQYVVKYF